MKNIKTLLVLFTLIITITACGAVKGNQHLFIETEVPGSTRTIKAAREIFNDQNVTIGKTTESDIKRLLGSPSTLNEKNGMKIYSYVKTVKNKGISSDPGTVYHVKHTFLKDEILVQSHYSAIPIRNPLLN